MQVKNTNQIQKEKKQNNRNLIFIIIFRTEALMNLTI
jgi:hypothetical protein